MFSVGKYDKDFGMNPGYYKKKRLMYADDREIDQKGSGIATIATILTAIQVAENIKKISEGAYNLYGSENANNLRNVYGNYINPHLNSRPGFAGERPMIDPKTGSFYNWLVKDRNTKERLKRDDPPLDTLDSCEKNRAIGYEKSKSRKDVRRADNIFLECAKKSKNPISKGLVRGITKIKKRAEDLNLSSFDKYGYTPNLTDGVGLSTPKESSMVSEKVGGKHFNHQLTRKIRKKKPNPIKKLEARFKKAY